MSLIRRKLAKLERRKATSPMPDLTAMLDIVFILIVFFVLTANVAQNIFDLELPKGDEGYSNEAKIEEKEIKITLFENGDFALGDAMFTTFSSFKQAVLDMHKNDANAKFLIIPEKTLEVQILMEFITFLKANEITKIDILLQK